MHLPILAVAFAIYILGIALVLYFRPALMFRPGGSWKEFGIGRGENHSVFPFWLFAVFWAFISYGLGLVIMSQFAMIALSSFPEPSMQQVAPPAMQPVARPVSSMLGLQQNSVPGYYVLQNTSQTASPQYVYYGTEPPPVR
jgi:hypothetical protein